MGRDSLIEMVERNLEQVDAHLPGMEKFSTEELKTIIRMISSGDIVNDITCLGWAFWPTENKGYLDERFLRMIADFLEIQNKPFWDDYEKWCENQYIEDGKENVEEVFFDNV